MPRGLIKNKNSLDQYKVGWDNFGLFFFVLFLFRITSPPPPSLQHHQLTRSPVPFECRVCVRDGSHRQYAEKGRVGCKSTLESFLDLFTRCPKSWAHILSDQPAYPVMIARCFGMRTLPVPPCDAPRPVSTPRFFEYEAAQE